MPARLFVLPLLLLLLLGGCQKDNPEAGLPPATQEGRNTGGCLINGERFVATASGGSLFSNPTPPLDGGYAFDSLYYLSLNGQYKGEQTSIMLFLRRRVVGTYLLNQTTLYYPQGTSSQVRSHATFSITGASGEVYVTNAQHTGQVTLTRTDYQAGITAGTFSFTAVSQQDPSKTITITSGRFDRKQ